MNAPEGIPDLAASLARRPPTREAFTAGASFGVAPADALPLAEPERGPLTDWLAAEVAEVTTPDDKLAAAYLMNSLSWAVPEPLAWVALDGVALPDIPPEAVAVTARREQWEEDGESGVAVAYDLVLDPALIRPAPGMETADALGALVAGLFAPLVAAVSRRSGLSRGALWRLVGDGLSATLLALGKEAGCEDRAMDMARAVLADRRTPLFSRQTGFVRIDLPERPEIAEWFRARGGCCRYYTAEGSEYCTTCVLRDKKSRDARLREHLRRKNGLLVA
ncbi:(2Fe-2S)-binding protein [Histidinibacterium lentulum]|uniref:Ferric iron reductase n=1 Tax=Histidinibacterium lentulum TaxID=2480588 RepID=A0A3N2R4N8_9RHOB|nr:(2Fe-2S)-binding protein [Histidinibacterium lentulum]ROU02452.1 ferric iron reductase [Histidinibacterium lentulum]